jgi:diguanylate cyclase (GGDEF)-like protein
VTVRSGTLAVGVSTSVVAPAPAPARNPQAGLLVDLVAIMSRDTPSVEHLAAVVCDHLSGLGLHAATVFTLEPDDGTLRPVAGPPGCGAEQALAGRVFRTPAGGAPVVDGARMAVRLRVGGQTVGVLVLTGGDPAALHPDVVAALALHFATTLQALTAERQRHFITHATATIRRLFEEGTVATSVEAAGELLATATAEAFRTEHAAMNLVDAEGRIVHAVGVGLDPALTRALSGSLIGLTAADSPVWRAARAAGGPVLVEDTASAQVRPGGFVQTMALRSYVAMPLMSAHGPVGMVVCGDSSRTRRWSDQDRVLARQLAVEGALIVDSARMRQAEAAHLRALTHQAFHDALTGLPNRSHLLRRAGEAVGGAGRTALLLLDLDGFKQVNDRLGHHAGDLLLHAVGRRLLEAVRDGDLVSRLGGDEFAVLLTRDADEGSATAVAGRVLDRCREPFDLEGERVTIGASVGIALTPDDVPVDVTTLMRGADAAMYRAKRSGGGFRLAR